MMTEAYSTVSEVVYHGVPVQPDVDKLVESFKEIPEGDLISHNMISAVTGEPYGTNRYRTIVIAWKKHMTLQYNVQIGPVYRRGYMKLVPKDRVNENVKTFQQGVRKQERALDNTLRIDRSKLTAEDNKRVDHMIHLGATSVLHGRMAMRTINAVKLPQPSELMPRITPPEASA